VGGRVDAPAEATTLPKVERLWSHRTRGMTAMRQSPWSRPGSVEANRDDPVAAPNRFGGPLRYSRFSNAFH
jgi:hypothetical protein